MAFSLLEFRAWRQRLSNVPARDWEFTLVTADGQDASLRQAVAPDSDLDLTATRDASVVRIELRTATQLLVYERPVDVTAGTALQVRRLG